MDNTVPAGQSGAQARSVPSSDSREAEPVAGDQDTGSANVQQIDEAKPSSHEEVSADKERQRSSLLKKISVPRTFWTSIAMIFAGLIILPISLSLLPDTADVSSPSPLSFTIESPKPILELDYTAQRVSSGSMIRLYLWTQPKNVPALNRNHATIQIDFTQREIFPVFTPRSRLPSLDQVSVTFDRHGLATKSYLVPGHNLVEAHNNLEEVVSIPQIQYIGPGQPLVRFAYHNLPSASSYDWSSFPPAYMTNDNWIRWDGSLVNGAWASRTVTGLDHTNQQNADHNTFLAGALVGVAGAALVGAFQEFLHALNDRRSNLPNAVSSECRDETPDRRVLVTKSD